MAPEPFRLTAVEALQAFSSGTLTVEEYAQSLLRRIEERDPVVKAWAHINPSQVIEQAKALDRVPKDQRGPLHGVAVAIKDVIYTKGAYSFDRELVKETDIQASQVYLPSTAHQSTKMNNQK